MAQASAEKLEQTGLAKKEGVASVPQREQLASMPEPPLPTGKGTKPSVRSTYYFKPVGATKLDASRMHQ